MKKLTIAVLLLFTTVLQAQTYKFGKVPKEQLEMTVYEKDSTASAVVLFSVGETNLDYRNNEFRLSIKRHVRIKILTDEGLEKGDVSILFRNEGAYEPQEVKNIKAESYTLQENGKVKKESVGRRDRYTERLSDRYSEVKFTIPGLKKGSVMEFSYELNSNNPLDFPDWYFQDDIPVIYSEYKAKIPEWFNYLTVTRGFEKFDVSQQKVYTGNFTVRETQDQQQVTTSVINTAGQRSDYRVNFNGTEYIYAMNDLPAIKGEPYMKATSDYLSHIRYQLESIQFPNQKKNNYLGSWGGLVYNLLEDEDYGDRLKTSKELADATASAIEGLETDLDKLIAVYNRVKEVMEWDEYYGLYAFDSLKDIYKEGTGNGTAINLILVQMLREAGIEAHPVAISTRTNGEVITLFPLAGQFNHTIAYVEIGEETYLLDAKGEHRPYNLLPSDVLNGRGIIVYEGEKLWIPLENKAKNSLVHMVDINITEDGFTGTLNSNTKGYYALSNRVSFDLDDLNGSIQEEIFEEMEGFSVDSTTINKDKLDESFDYTVHFNYKDDSQSNIRYLNPMIMQADKENPFSLEERTFPVDYNYTFSENMIIKITIPEGWVFDEAPKSVLHRLPEKAGDFRRITQVNGNTVSINYRFRINKNRFMPTEYGIIKELYEVLAASLKENIVLKKES